MNAPVDGSWSADPAVAFDPKQLTIAHPCYPLEPFDALALDAYVKAQARPKWMQGGNDFDAFFWARCRYSGEQILWRDIRNFVFQGSHPDRITSFMRQEVEARSGLNGHARIVVTPFDVVNDLSDWNAPNLISADVRRDIRALLNRRVPQLGSPCPLRHVQLICEVAHGLGLVYFPLGYAWAKHCANLRAAEQGDADFDRPEVTDYQSTYSDFIHYEVIEHKDQRSGAVMLYDARLVDCGPHDDANIVDCGPYVRQAANAASLIYHLLARERADRGDPPYEFVSDFFSRETLGADWDEFSYDAGTFVDRVPYILFDLARRPGLGYGILDAWNDDRVVEHLSTHTGAQIEAQKQLFKRLLLQAHLNGTALLVDDEEDERPLWPGLLYYTTDANRVAFYEAEPAVGEDEAFPGVGRGLYRGKSARLAD